MESILLHASYPIIFLLMFIDGTSVNFIASSISAGGVLNVKIVCVLAFCAELIADIAYYSIGRKIDTKKILGRIKNEGSRNFLTKINKSFSSKPFLALIITKFLGPIAIPGIMYLGSIRALRMQEFILTAMSVTLVRALTISYAGYMVGKGVSAYAKLYGTFNTAWKVLVGGIILYFVIRYVYKKIMEIVMKKVD